MLFCPALLATALSLAGAGAVASSEPTHRRGPPIEDPSGRALAHFFEALEQTEIGVDGAVTRVLHMGDSSMGLDGLAHPIRAAMQERFGDAGPGFLPTEGYTRSYSSKVAVHSGRGWRTCYIGRLCAGDGYYGIGGHSFTASRGASATFATTAAGKLGDEVSHYELWFAHHPRGARLEVAVDGGATEIVETAQSELSNGFHWIDVDSGAHELRVVTKGAGVARLFGVVAENDGPGVVWDSVTMVGAFTRRLQAYDEDHIEGQIAQRRPDLLVLNFGGNDLLRFVKGSMSSETYREEFRSVIHRLRAGHPRMAFLVAGIVDHGKSGGLLVDPKHVRRMNEAQRMVAAEEHCGFFDTVRAMGGVGSMVRWSTGRPRLAESDQVHLNRRGRARVAGLMFEALMDGYDAFKTGRPSQGTQTHE